MGNTLRWLNNNRGFTLIETTVATAIICCLGVGAAAAVTQVINVNASSSNHVTVVKQVESAVHWISRDAQMAQILQPAEGSGFPLSLTWVEWDNIAHQVTYSLDNGRLIRSHTIDGGEPVINVVAELIDPDGELTSCDYTGGLFNLKITALVNGFKSKSESRTVQVIPRPAP